MIPANDLTTDTEFDAYWEEEARNPHRNRIRIGRQYQATIPPRLKSGMSLPCDHFTVHDSRPPCPLSACRVHAMHLLTTDQDHTALPQAKWMAASWTN